MEGRVVSTTEVFDKISSRLVPFEMVAKVFKDMTSEGGKFYNMQEVQAETLKGKISNLKDAYEVMLNEIGTAHQDKLKGAIDAVRRMISNYEEVGRQMLACVAIFGVTRTALELLGISMGKLNVKSMSIVSTFRNITAIALKNPYVLLAAGITAVGAAMYKANDYARDYLRIQKSVAENQDKFNKSLATETSKLDSLYAKLKFAKEGTEEYDTAKKKIYSQYAGYISELKAEGVEVGNLAILYDELKKKIIESTQVKYRATARQDLEQRYTEGIDDAYRQFEKAVKRFEDRRDALFSEQEKEGLWQYLLGDEDILKDNPVLHGVMNLVDSEIKSGDRRIEWLRTSLRKIITEYEEGGKRIDALFGTEPPQTDTFNPIVNLGGGDEKSAAEKVQEEIDAVKRLRDAYETLAPYMNGEMLRKTLTALFPNADQQLIQSLDFRGKLVALAAELNKFDEEASKKLLDSLSGERASEIASAFKAVETYKNMLDQWLGEDFNLTGEGVTFDISKILRDLNNQYAKINQKAIQASDLLTKAQMGDEDALKTVREVYGEEVWQKYLINGQDVIEELARKEREEARKVADDKIKDLSQKYVKELMTRDNINLTDFDDKTVRQIDELINRLYGLRAEIGNNMFALEFGGLSEEEMSQYEMLKKSLEQIDLLIKDTDVEKEKAMFDQLKDGLEAVSQLGGEVEALGEAIGDANLARLGKDLSQAADLAADLAEAFKANDTIAIIANVLSYSISKITELATTAYDYQKALNDASREYQDIMNDIRRESHSGLFGVDDIALAAENTRILADEQKRYADSVDAISRKKFQKFGGSFWRNDSVLSALEDASKAQGWDLYLANGEFNISALESYFDAYSSRLSKKQQELVLDLIESSNAYNDAATQQAEYLKSLYGDVADTIAENMVNAFIESGDAAIDMGELVSNTAKTMVADLIKTLYLMPILNSYQKQAEEIQKNASLTPDQKVEAQLNLLDTALGNIAEREDDINATLERFADYLGTGEGAKDLGEGIKGITEDQANLLASYLNAIRADVAYSKVLWQRMDANTQMIADTLRGFSAPTLMDYQKRIEANTYNNMIATQEILAELRSMVVLGNEGSALRVYKDN